MFFGLEPNYSWMSSTPFRPCSAPEEVVTRYLHELGNLAISFHANTLSVCSSQMIRSRSPLMAEPLSEEYAIVRGGTGEYHTITTIGKNYGAEKRSSS